jgi:hypothetical protein
MWTATNHTNIRVPVRGRLCSQKQVCSFTDTREIPQASRIGLGAFTGPLPFGSPRGRCFDVIVGDVMSATPVTSDTAPYIAAINAVKRARGAAIRAHNYQAPEHLPRRRGYHWRLAGARSGSD